MSGLGVAWFVILGALLGGYAVLDGFDLGVGILHLFTRGERERRLAINSIGPLWDGNEVWLVTFGGALFAAFPEAYATILSAMYLPVFVLLFGLIGRAISIEFRSKIRSPFWKSYWDASFALSSLTVVVVFGVAAGNAIAGIPLDADGEFAGTLIDLFTPYSLATGLFAASVAAMHGAIFLHLKTEGELSLRARSWMWRTFFVFLGCYVLTTGLTFVYAPRVLDDFARWPIAWVVVVLNVLAVLNIPRAIHLRRPGYAFVSSSATILALVFLLGMALFPNLVVSSAGTPSLTIDNARSSDATLTTMLYVAAIGAPLVCTYTAIVYWVFRGKVRLTNDSY
ncbi:MAG: cytochrome d ubiquinol oxidase subunit II [Sandaracinaceae bacterium]